MHVGLGLGIGGVVVVVGRTDFGFGVLFLGLGAWWVFCGFGVGQVAGWVLRGELGGHR